MVSVKKAVLWLNFAVLTSLAMVWYAINSHQYSLAVSKLASEPDFEERRSEIWSCVLYNARARVLPPIKFNHEYDRFVVSAFLHKGPSHLIGNLSFHWFLLSCIIEYYSMWEVLFSTYYSILSGNIISGAYMPNEISVGSSGFIFSLLGLMLIQSLVTLVLSKKYRIQTALKLLVALVFCFFAFSPQNDRLNHAHGILVGLVVGLLKIAGYRRDYIEEANHRRKWRLVVLLSKIVLGVVPLAHLIWIVFFYGEPKDHAAAILNMGCESSL